MDRNYSIPVVKNWLRQLNLAGIILSFLVSCSSDSKPKTAEKIKPITSKPIHAGQDTASKNIDYLEANEILLKYQSYLAPYKFEDFRVKDKYKGEPAPIDLISDIDAALFQKTFTQALKTGSNFAGHYTLVSISCGTNCQDNYIIDTRTGKVCDKVRSILGASYKINSKLLILNAPDPMNVEIYQQLPASKPEVYVMQNNLLYKAKLVN